MGQVIHAEIRAEDAETALEEGSSDLDREKARQLRAEADRLGEGVRREEPAVGPRKGG